MDSIKIAGFVPNSFVDFPGKIAAVIFLGGCNMACHYCHNSHILKSDSNVDDFNVAFEQIKERISFLDGVVVSGGEPTFHKQLTSILHALKGLGVLIKLDTNGTNPQLLKQLIDDGLVDYVAMDVKAPIEKYPDITGLQNNELLKNICSSIEYLKDQNRVGYMFRTTLSPLLNDNDIKEIGKLVNGCKTYQLQQFVPNAFSEAQKVVHLPYTQMDAERFKLMLSKYCGEVLLRGF